jgi:large subunit ribosomal protein L15
MPLQRRLPKVGFRSRKARQKDEIRLNELKHIEGDVVSIATLRAADLISIDIKDAKLINTGKVERAYRVEGLRVTAGARAAIEAAGGLVTS